MNNNLKDVTNTQKDLANDNDLFKLEKYAASKFSGINRVKMITKNGQTKHIVFKTINEIGRGSFGIVNKIKTLDTDTYLALKIVRINPLYYYRELDILKSLSHPNILDLVGYFNTEDIQNKTNFVCLITLYYPYTMEFAINNQNMFISKIKNIYKQGLEALQYLHSLQICHRDIKPQNILLDNSFNPVICDFGSAKQLIEKKPNISYICSRYYRAPECCLGKDDYDCKIDIWSLGVVFLEFMLGRTVFIGKNNDEILHSVLNVVKYSKKDVSDMQLPFYKDNVGVTELYCGKNYYNQVFCVIERSLVVNPKYRPTASELLQDTYFDHL